ncbi:hypothetical protein GQ472_01955 [archaeon]|nr:hypothetical protein [archaeon]
MSLSDRYRKMLDMTIDFCDMYPLTVLRYGIVSHPLFTSLTCRDIETGKIVILCPDNIKEQKTKIYDRMSERLTRSPDIGSIMTFIQKPYKIPLLLLLERYMTCKQFSVYAIALWTQTEFPHQNGQKTMMSMFDKTERRHIMTESDREAYDMLPDQVKVYRGLQKDAMKRGLSWTVSLSVAEWFADRFSRKGQVLVAMIPKDRIYAFIKSRHEDEIILNPLHLRSVRILDRSEDPEEPEPEPEIEVT